MLQQTELFNNAERFVIDRSIIDAVALPVGDNYGDELFHDYFADYAGMTRRYKPKRIYEIGVRYGYIGICMMLALQSVGERAEYVGIDDESYHPCLARANQNFAQVLPGWLMQAMRWNSFDGVPPGIGTFDFIHIDGNHDYHGVMSDLLNCWPILNPGGFILLDDAAQADDQGWPGPIFAAIQDFLRQFEHSEQRVEWQYQQNARCHVYVHKCA